MDHFPGTGFPGKNPGHVFRVNGFSLVHDLGQMKGVSGKGLLAKAIHTSGTRKDAPFVPVNCASIPDTLFESELFGYDEGAFTGAKKGGNPGRFELAHQGTLFLDEIGEMPLHLQAKLLNVLQDLSLQRVGGITTIPVDVRVIAATNQDLETLVRKKKFRSDLFYRLNVIPMDLPTRFLDKIGRSDSGTNTSIKQKSLAAQADAIQNCLDQYGHDLQGKKKTAEKLGISIRTLYRKLKTH